MHESGFRYIEYGYIDKDDNGVERVEVVGRYDILQLPYGFQLRGNIDLTKSGWFRILSENLEWGYGGEIRQTQESSKADEKKGL
jgi:hypothetical protein